MAFEANTSGDGGMYPQHPKTGDWNTLKGSMLAPHEEPPLLSTAMDNKRPQSDSAMPSQSWDATEIVNTGMTGGGGTMAH